MWAESFLDSVCHAYYGTTLGDLFAYEVKVNVEQIM